MLPCDLQVLFTFLHWDLANVLIEPVADRKFIYDKKVSTEKSVEYLVGWKFLIYNFSMRAQR